MLRQKQYDQAVDVFAAGCIFAELFTGDPLLPGSSETDMLHRLSRLIGCVPSSWSQGFEMAAGIGLMNLPGALVCPSREQVLASLQKVMPAASTTALDLICKMIAWNPRERPTCQECLKHPYFVGSRHDDASKLQGAQK